MNKLQKAWWAISVIAVAALYFFFDRRGKQLATLKHEVESKKLADKLSVIKEKADGSQKDYEMARDEYLKLKSSLPHLFEGGPKP
jgi:hypothetical protein